MGHTANPTIPMLIEPQMEMTESSGQTQEKTTEVFVSPQYLLNVCYVVEFSAPTDL